MAAVDKLHKLYSSTFEPLVWVRSVGLEVLNEFDSIKTAIMMSAGASSRRFDTGDETNQRPDVLGWTMAASGVEGLASGARAAKTIGEGLIGMVGAGLQGLVTSAGNRDHRK